MVTEEKNHERQSSSSSSSSPPAPHPDNRQKGQGNEREGEVNRDVAAVTATNTKALTSIKSNADKFLLYLNLMLSIENAALERLHARIQQCPIPEAKDMLVRHLEETRVQKNRLVDLIHNIGSEQRQSTAALHGSLSNPTNERAALPEYQPPKVLAEMLAESSTPIEQELKTMEIDWLIENAEVIEYSSLIQMAQKMGFGNAMVSLRQSLEEEERMVAWIRANSPSIIGRYWNQMGTDWTRQESMAA